MPIQESGQMYLETIHILQKRDGHVRAIDISEYMGYSKPSISRAVGLLKRDGYILVDADGSITLTPTGLGLAEKIFERHTLISKLLISLGVTPEVAAEDACKIEHAISDESFEALKRHVQTMTAP